MRGASPSLVIWKRVTVAMGAVFVLSVMTSLGSLDPYTLARLAISLLALNGLAGLAWQRAVLKRWIWQALVVFQGVGLAISVLNFSLLLGNQTDDISFGSWLVMILLLLLQVTLVVGLYLYAYRSPHVWAVAKLDS